MQHYIDTTTQELYAFEKGADPSFIPSHLVECPARPSPYESFVNGAWVKDAAAIAREQSDLLAAVRVERDVLLSDTDKYLVADFPITAALLTKVKTYRTSLRDVPTAADPRAALDALVAAKPI